MPGDEIFREHVNYKLILVGKEPILIASFAVLMGSHSRLREARLTPQHNSPAQRIPPAASLSTIHCPLCTVHCSLRSLLL